MYCKSIFQLAFYENLDFFLDTFFLRMCPIFVDSDDSFGKKSIKRKQFLMTAKLYIILNAQTEIQIFN